MYWIPLDVLIILSLCQVDLPVEMSNWFAVFVLPISAITDPLIFSLYMLIAVRGKKGKKQKSWITFTILSKIFENPTL